MSPPTAAKIVQTAESVSRFLNGRRVMAAYARVVRQTDRHRGSRPEEHHGEHDREEGAGDTQPTDLNDHHVARDSQREEDANQRNWLPVRTFGSEHGGENGRDKHGRLHYKDVRLA